MSTSECLDVYAVPLLNTVAHMDCFDLMRSIPDESIDLICTDPPYGISYKSGKWHGHYVRGKHKVIKKDIDPIEGDDQVIDFFAEARRVLKLTGAIYVFTSWKTVDLWKPLMEKHFTIRNKLVWIKNNHTMGNWQSQYRNKYEEVLYGDAGAHMLRGPKGHTDLLEYPRVPDSRRNHPAEKPVALLEHLILESSDEGDVVFDPFAGSGSTLVAAKNLGRNFIGAEVEEKYVDVSLERLRQ